MTKATLRPTLAALALIAALWCAPDAAASGMRAADPWRVARPAPAVGDIVTTPLCEGFHLGNSLDANEVAPGRPWWLSRDPLGERGGLNLYGFVGNDPVNKYDYLGLLEVVGFIGNHPVVGDPKFIALLAGKQFAGDGGAYDALGVALYDPANPSLDPGKLHILPALANLPDGPRGTGTAALLSNRYRTFDDPLSMQNAGTSAQSTFDIRVALALGAEATSAYPWGTLSAGEIGRARDEGYISGVDVPTGGFDWGRGAFRSADAGGPLVPNPTTWRDVGKSSLFVAESTFGMLDFAVVGAATLAKRGGDFVSFYHGTSKAAAANIRSKGIDLAFSRAKTDFGKGFYTTTDLAQAQKWAARNGGEVLEFRLSGKALGKLNGLVLGAKTQSSLLRFIRHNRLGGKLHSFDAVSGPMLGNPKAFLRGTGGRTFGQQTSFHSEDAIDLLFRGLQP